MDLQDLLPNFGNLGLDSGDNMKVQDEPEMVLLNEENEDTLHANEGTHEDISICLIMNTTDRDDKPIEELRMRASLESMGSMEVPHIMERSAVRFGHYELYTYTFQHLEKKELKKGFKCEFEAFLVGESVKLVEVGWVPEANSPDSKGASSSENRTVERAHKSKGQHVRYFFRWNYYNTFGQCVDARCKNNKDNRKNNYIINLVQLLYEYEHAKIDSSRFVSGFLALEDHFKPLKGDSKDGGGQGNVFGKGDRSRNGRSDTKENATLQNTFEYFQDVFFKYKEDPQQQADGASGVGGGIASSSNQNSSGGLVECEFRAPDADDISLCQFLRLQKFPNMRVGRQNGERSLVFCTLMGYFLSRGTGSGSRRLVDNDGAYSGRPEPTTTRLQFPEIWVNYLIDTIPESVSHIETDYSKALIVADYTYQDVEFTFRHMLSAKWSYVRVGLRELTRTCYKEMGQFDFMRIFSMLVVFGVQPQAQPLNVFPQKLVPKIEASYQKRVRKVMKTLGDAFSNEGVVQRKENLLEAIGPDNEARRLEVEKNDLLPEYYKVIEPLTHCIEYCPTMSFLLNEILKFLPERIIWLVEDANSVAAEQRILRRGNTRGNNSEGNTANQPPAQQESWQLGPLCYLINQGEQFRAGGAGSGRSNNQARKGVKKHFGIGAGMGARYQDDMAMTPLMLNVLQLLENFDIQEREIVVLQEICKRFQYTYAPVYAILNNTGTPYSLSENSLISLLKIPETLQNSKRCLNSLQEWLRNKFSASNSLKSGGMNSGQQFTKSRMRETFIAFSRLISCPQIRKFHTRLIEEVGHFWFFQQIESWKIIQNVLSIEDLFSWRVNVIEPHQELIVLPVVERILTSARKVCTDAYEEDASILRTILKGATTFRFELLNLILMHRIDMNRSQLMYSNATIYANDANASAVSRAASATIMPELEDHDSLCGGLLSPILKEASLIKLLVETYQFSGDQRSRQMYGASVLGKKIEKIKEELTGFLARIVAGTITLHRLHDMLKHKVSGLYQFLKLLNITVANDVNFPAVMAEIEALPEVERTALRTEAERILNDSMKNNSNNPRAPNGLDLNTIMICDLREKQLRQFDSELEEFSIYVKMYCKSANIECATLNQKVESLHKHYNNKMLRDAQPEFQSEPVLQHVKKLFDLRNSELFLDIWSRIGQHVQEQGGTMNGGPKPDGPVQPAGGTDVEAVKNFFNGVLPMGLTKPSASQNLPKELLVTNNGEIGIEFEALTSDITVWGLCRELPMMQGIPPTTMTLWDTETQKALGICRNVGPQSMRNSSGSAVARFEGGIKVTLKRGKIYRISVAREESTNLVNEYFWMSYGTVSNAPASGANDAGSGSNLQITIQKGAAGIFRGSVYNNKRGQFPGTYLRNNLKARGISVGFVVDKRQMQGALSSPSGRGSLTATSSSAATRNKGGKKFVEIGQSVAVNDIIPTAFKQWDELAGALVFGNQDLDTGFKLFGILGNRQNRPTLSQRRLEDEIYLLQNTTNIIAQYGGLEKLKADSKYMRREGLNGLTNDKWAQSAIEDVKELRFLERLMLWLPGILAFHKSCREFLFPKVGADTLVQELEQSWMKIQSSKSNWVTGLIMHEIIPYKQHLAGISNQHQDFITTFVSRKDALQWLLTHTDNDAFDKKIRLVRPCTDDEVLLRALNNLSELRRVISDLYYKPADQQVHASSDQKLAPNEEKAQAIENCKHYENLRSFLEYYTTSGIKFTWPSARAKSSNEETEMMIDNNRITPDEFSETEQMSSLRVITVSWDRLQDLLERNTLSPGIKACREVRPMMQNGVFIFHGTQDTNLQLICRVRKHMPGERRVEYTDVRFEQLAETRRLLLMTEPPEEEEQKQEALDEDVDMIDNDEKHVKAMAAFNKMKLVDLVDEFVRKLEVLEDIRHLVADLHSNGHFDFAHGEVLTLSPIESIETMKQKKSELHALLTEWQQNMREIRGQYYFLNFFVVKHLQSLRDDFLAVEERFWEKGCLPLRPNYLVSGELKTDLVFLLSESDVKNQSQTPPHPRSGGLMDAGQFLKIMERLVNVRQYITGEKILSDSLITLLLTGKFSGQQPCADEEPIVSFCHLLLQTLHQMGRFPRQSATEQIHYIGKLLDVCFGNASYREKKIAWIQNRSNTFFSKQKLQQGDLLIQDIDIERKVIVEPASTSAKVDDGEENEQKTVPIFACTTRTEDQVVGLVLSVYFRRERLPDPQEVLLCTEMTTPEEIEIIIRRFIQARKYGRGKCVYCIGNIQLLSYQIQCRAVEMLGVLLQEYGVNDAAALVLVSGSPNQMFLTASTSQCGVQYINVSSLSEHELQLCLKHAVPSVSAAFGPDINGCGKTDHILRECFEIQSRTKNNRQSVYRKVSIRENTDKKDVIQAAMSIILNKKKDMREDEFFVAQNYPENSGKYPQWLHNGIATGDPNSRTAEILQAISGGTVVSDSTNPPVGTFADADAGGANTGGSGNTGAVAVSRDEGGGDGSAAQSILGGEELKKNLNYDHLIHLDLAHVVQKRTNIVLFELLCVGCVIDAQSSSLYFRNPRDRYIVEIPATPGNTLFKHLSVLNYLKKEVISCKPQTLVLDRPIFLGGWIDTQRNRSSQGQAVLPHTRTRFIQIVENRDMLVTCKFLRALNKERFLKSQEEDRNAQSDQALLAEPITEQECWDILFPKCCRVENENGQGRGTEVPSFLTYNLFCRFMHSQFERTMNFALLQPRLSRQMGLDRLRHFFCEMLVATSADFSLRQVPKYEVMDKMIVENTEEMQRELFLNTGSGAGSPAVSTGGENLSASFSSAVDNVQPLSTPVERLLPAERLLPLPGESATNRGPLSGEPATGPAAQAHPATSSTGVATTVNQRSSSRGRTSRVTGRAAGQAGGGGNRGAQQNDMRARRELSELEALQTELGKERMGAGKMSSASLVDRFRGMVNWESKDHPLSIFKLARTNKVSGIDIISLNRTTVEQNWKLDRQFTRSLDNNGLKVFKDWSTAPMEECMRLVRMAKGLSEARAPAHKTLGKTQYVLTIDNLLKIMSILLRLEYQLPAIIMGETGCGKTALVEFICDMLHFKLEKLDLHGGITDAEITKFFKRCMESAAKLAPGEYLIAFLDEINAANCMAHCKTLIVDRFVENERLPHNIRIVACCNPYRLRKNKENEQMGLVYQHHFADGGIVSKTDSMKKLVYRVHQLPESLIDLVSDFGALSDKTEALYIDAILRREMPLAPQSSTVPQHVNDYENFIASFGGLLRTSQQYIRQINNNERSVVSLRDVARASRVFRWFLRHYTRLVVTSAGSSSSSGPASASSSSSTGNVAVSDIVRLYQGVDGVFRIMDPGLSRDDPNAILTTSLTRTTPLATALLLTLSFCYYSRLAREDRDGYHRTLWQTVSKQVEVVNHTIKGPGAPQTERRYTYAWLQLRTPDMFTELLERAQLSFVSQMNLGKGIALNEALRENLFMLLVSVMNQIPIFVIGKPGCSKSLAVSILQDNLKGSVSDQPLFKNMPSIEVLPYQCSPLSTADGIENAFDNARKYQGGGDDSKTIVVVLLDEVGLAEESPHLPLKVLHKELESPGRGITCIGISNWALDAAKMSRAVHLYRSPPTIDDLTLTAEGMIQNNQLKMYLRSLAEAFHAIYKEQTRQDFWGLREFYSTVRVVNAELKNRADRGESQNLDADCLMKTVLRNFGGCTQVEMNDNIQKFFSMVGMRPEDGRRYSIPDLIKQNLDEADARHLMLLTKNNSALRLLFDSGIISYEQETEILFGSSFLDDQSDVMVATNLNKIRSVMTKPIQLVLVHCDALYESLYDLLNQHYMEFSNQRYVRIAHGSSSKQCPIHHKFRVIVIVEKADAWTRLAPPLLNRFEKQIFVRSQLLTTKKDKLLLSKLEEWLNLFIGDIAGQSSSQLDINVLKRRCIPGFHSDILPSLVVSLQDQDKKKKVESEASFRDGEDGVAAEESAYKNLHAKLGKALHELCWVLTPEAVTTHMAAVSAGNSICAKKFNPREHPEYPIIGAEYFDRQSHGDLRQFVTALEAGRQECASTGTQTMVMTYTPMVGGTILADVIRTPQRSVSHFVLHTLSSASDLEHRVQAFYFPKTYGRGATDTDGDIDMEDTAMDVDSENDNCAHEYLLIEADPIASSDRQIEYCRCICEKFQYLYGKKNPTGRAKHVLLVVHLSRNRSDTSTFLLDFDRRWRAVFIDAVGLAEKSGLPSLTNMLNKDLCQVMELVDFQFVLTNQCLRPSLARLIYPSKRGTTELKTQISSLLELCRNMDFINLFRTLVMTVMQRFQTLEEKEHQNKLKEEERRLKAKGLACDPVELQELAQLNVVKNCWYSDDVEVRSKAGTFCGALHYRLLRILQVQIAKMLAYFDRNHGLQLFSKYTQNCLELAHFVISDPNCKLQFDMLNKFSLKETKGLEEVLNDARSERAPLYAQFPFSYFIAQTIDSLKLLVQNKLEVEGAAKCSSAVASSYGLPLDPVFKNAGISNIRYLHDFVCMNVLHSPNLTRWQQARLVLALIRKTFEVVDDEKSNIDRAERTYENFYSNPRNDSGTDDEGMAVTKTDGKMLLQEFPIKVDFPILQFPNTFFDIHVGYWLNEKRIFFLNQILTCCPRAVGAILSAIQHETLWDCEEKTCRIALPYTKNQRLLGFNALLATIVVDHLIEELFDEMEGFDNASLPNGGTNIGSGPSQPTLFRAYTDWLIRAKSLVRHVKDLLNECFACRISPSNAQPSVDANTSAVVSQLNTLMQNRINLFRDVKIPKLELVSTCVRKLILDCNNHTVTLTPLLSFLNKTDTLVKSKKTIEERSKNPTTKMLVKSALEIESWDEHVKAQKLTFRSVSVVEKLLLGYGQFLKSIEAKNSTGTTEVSSSSSSSAFNPPSRVAALSSRGKLYTALRKKLGETLEWLYLDCWLLASANITSVQKNNNQSKLSSPEPSNIRETLVVSGAQTAIDVDYLTEHLDTQSLKHLCAHASGRPCCIRHNTLMPHDGHDPSVIAYVPSAAAVSGSAAGGPTQDEVPCSSSFILALLRRLRRLGSPIIEQEIRMLLERAQTKNKNSCRDTEFATSVCIVEEEIEKSKLRLLMDIHEEAETEPSPMSPTSNDVIMGDDHRSPSPIPERPAKRGKFVSSAAILSPPDMANLEKEERINLANMYLSGLDDPRKLLEKLKGVAKFRAYLSEYVDYLRSNYLLVESGREPLEKRESPIRRRIVEICEQELREEKAAKKTFPIRSARMLALKMWERTGGSSELQNGMASPPLCNAIAWFNEWRNDGEAQDLNGFLGGSKLPRWNPYHDYNTDGQEFGDADSIVSAFALHCDVARLEAHLRSAMSRPLDEQRRILGGLVLRFSGSGLQKAVANAVQWEERLCEWTRRSESFSTGSAFSQAFPKGYLNILLYFLGENVLHDLYRRKQLQNEGLFGGWDYWFLNQQSTSEQIAQFRFLPQFLACVWSAPKNSILHCFRDLMENPKPYCTDGPHKSWLPGMEVDIREICAGAIKDYTVTFSRFCVCPNGHPYYIGDCGQAFTKAKCPECNEEIGGGGHQLLKTNKRMNTDDQAPPGYTHLFDLTHLDPATKKVKPAAKDNFSARRALIVPSFVCVTRLLTHAAMWCGLVMRTNYVLEGAAPTGSSAQQSSSSSSSSTIERPLEFYKQIVNTDYVSQNIGNEIQWVKHQFILDWRMLIEMLSSNPEDVSKLLHILLDRMHRRPERHNPASVDGDAAKGIEIDEARRTETSNDWLMPYDRDKRKLWEEVFVKGYLEELIPSTGIRRNELQEANQRWKNVDGPFLVELKENYELSSYTYQKRHAEETLLWNFRGEVTLDLLRQRVSSHYPILQHVFVMHYQFDCLQYLSDVLIFQRFLISFYSYRKTRAEAEAMTIRDVLNEVRHMETQDVAENVERAFSGYAAAWNSGFGSWVKQWECLEIPDEYLSVKMTLDTKLIFCLAMERDAGVCSLCLVQTMCESHNGFLDKIREQEKYLVRQNYDRGVSDDLDYQEGINELLKEIDSKVISTRDLVNRSDCLKFSLDELLMWVKDRATSYMEGGMLDFDLERIENYLIEKFRDIPKLQMELKLVRFTFQEDNLSSNLKQKLKNKLQIEGKQLAPEDIATLREHFNTNLSLAESFQRQLDLVGSFLVKTLDGVRDTALGSQDYLDYCSTVLMLTDDQIQATCGSAVMPVVRRMKLNHVIEVLDMLENLADDVFDAIPMQFKQPLASQHIALLKLAKPNMNLDLLLPALKTYIIDSTNDTMAVKPDSQIKAWLMYKDAGEDELASYPWFTDFFPEQITHANIIAVYEYLADKNAIEEEDKDGNEMDVDPMSGSKQQSDGDILME